MASIELRYLSGLDIKALDMTDAEILEAIEASLSAQGNGETVVEPRMHLIPDASFEGHFNVLRGYIATNNTAGVKIVGDYHNNYKQGLPSEFALLNLMDGKTGRPKAILDATAITEMRTGAVTAIGAKYLAPTKPESARSYRRTGYRPTGMFACSIIYLISKKYVFIHVAPKVEKPLRKDLRPIWVKPSPLPITGRIA